MALGVSDEIIVSFIQQPPRVVFPLEEPQHPNVEIVFSGDVAVAEVAHVDAFAIDAPRHIEAYERWYDIPRVYEAVEIHILQGGVAETVFIDKYDCPWRVALATLWEPLLDWRSREHANAFVADEAYVVDTFLIWYMPDGARHLAAFDHEAVGTWLASTTDGRTAMQLSATQSTTSMALGTMRYTGGSLTR